MKIINGFFAIAILCASLPAFAEKIGQLFFSAEERKLLDRQRQNPSPVYSATGTTITLNGVIQGSSGKAVIWVNGAPHDQLPITSNITQSVSIRVPETGQSIQLKPGQSFNTISGRISDLHTDVRSDSPSQSQVVNEPPRKPLATAKPIDKSKEKSSKK